MPLPALGRCIAGLAEAIQIRLYERDDVEHLRTTIAQLAHALSAIGQIIAEQTTDAALAEATTSAAVIPLPPGLVHRAARYLEATATLLTPETKHLADAFLADAAI